MNCFGSVFKAIQAHTSMHEVRNMLEVGFDPNELGKANNTPLHHVTHHQTIINDRKAFVTMLLQYRANVNAVNDAGFTPLHFAMKQPDSGIVTTLLTYGAKRIDHIPENALDHNIKEQRQFDDKKVVNDKEFQSSKISNYYEVGLQTVYNINTRLKMDWLATYSSTHAQIAHYRDLNILHLMHNVPLDCCVLDGTACVGGDTISFCEIYKTVVAVERDPKRFWFLRHNAPKARARCDDIRAVVQSDLFKGIGLLYLDPDWGGEGYDAVSSLSLHIGGMPLDLFVKEVLSIRYQIYNGPSCVQYVVLKLPKNFDRNQVANIFDVDNISISLHKILVNGAEKMWFIVVDQRNYVPPFAATTKDKFLQLKPMTHELQMRHHKRVRH